MDNGLKINHNVQHSHHHICKTIPFTNMTYFKNEWTTYKEELEHYSTLESIIKSTKKDMLESSTKKNILVTTFSDVFRLKVIILDVKKGFL